MIEESYREDLSKIKHFTPLPLKVMMKNMSKKKMTDLTMMKNMQTNMRTHLMMMMKQKSSEPMQGIRGEIHQAHLNIVEV